jgi:hypothetical protein
MRKPRRLEWSVATTGARDVKTDGTPGRKVVITGATRGGLAAPSRTRPVLVPAQSSVTSFDLAEPEVSRAFDTDADG